MKALRVAALLSLAMQFCGTAAAPQPLTCSDLDNRTASHLAIQHINKHHRRGYKFSVEEVSGAQLEKGVGGCSIELQLQLRETTCPSADPSELQDCGSRSRGEQVVVANCSVLLTVTDASATVTRYHCQTRQEMTNREMMMMCPDCPKLIPLNDPKGLESIHEAIKEFNTNVSNGRIFTLQDVGRIRLGYVSSTGMNYYSEFLLVETPCPVQSRIVHEACRPMCPDRARHAFCQSSYSHKSGLNLPLECEFYPAKNTTALGPREQEPICVPPRPNVPASTPPHAHGTPPHTQGHPPHAHGSLPRGPPPQAHGTPSHGQGPPPQAHGTPSHGQGPPPHAHGTPSHGQGPPPQAHGTPSHGQGPPPQAHGTPSHGQGPPPHAHGTPPKVHGPPPTQGKRRPPFPFLLPLPPDCMGMLAAADPAIHPICPWPLPVPPHPRGG